MQQEASDMAGIRHYLYIDSAWRDLSSICDSTTFTLELNLCNNSWQSAVSKASLTLNPTSLCNSAEKLAFRESVIAAALGVQGSGMELFYSCQKPDGTAVYSGVLDVTSLSIQSTSYPGSVTLGFVDMGRLLENKMLNADIALPIIAEGEGFPAEEEGIDVFSVSGSSVVKAICEAGGYDWASLIDVGSDVIADKIRAYSYDSTKKATARSELNRVLGESNATFYFTPEGKMKVVKLPQDPVSSAAVQGYQASDGIKTTAALWSSDGVLVKWHEISERDSVPLYNADLGTERDEDGKLIGTEIKPPATPEGEDPIYHYWPEHADSEEIYQEFSKNALDRDYITGMKARQNDSIQIVAVKNLKILSDPALAAGALNMPADVPGFTSNPETFPQKARLAIRNEASSSQHLKVLSITGDCLYKSSDCTSGLPLEAHRNPDEIETEWISTQARADAYCKSQYALRKHGRIRHSWSEVIGDLSDAKALGTCITVPHKGVSITSLAVIWQVQISPVGGKWKARYSAYGAGAWESDNPVVKKLLQGISNSAEESSSSTSRAPEYLGAFASDPLFDKQGLTPKTGDTYLYTGDTTSERTLGQMYRATGETSSPWLTLTIAEPTYSQSIIDAMADYIAVTEGSAIASTDTTLCGYQFFKKMACLKAIIKELIVETMQSANWDPLSKQGFFLDGPNNESTFYNVHIGTAFLETRPEESSPPTVAWGSPTHWYESDLYAALPGDANTLLDIAGTYAAKTISSAIKCSSTSAKTSLWTQVIDAGQTYLWTAIATGALVLDWTGPHYIQGSVSGSWDITDVSQGGPDYNVPPSESKPSSPSEGDTYVTISHAVFNSADHSYTWTETTHTYSVVEYSDDVYPSVTIKLNGVQKTYAQSKSNYILAVSKGDVVSVIVASSDGDRYDYGLFTASVKFSATGVKLLDSTGAWSEIVSNTYHAQDSEPVAVTGFTSAAKYSSVQGPIGDLAGKAKNYYYSCSGAMTIAGIVRTITSISYDSTTIRLVWSGDTSAHAYTQYAEASGSVALSAEAGGLTIGGLVKRKGATDKIGTASEPFAEIHGGAVYGAVFN